MSMTAILGLSILIGVAIGLPVRYARGIRRSFDQRMALAKNKPMYFEFDEVKARFIVPNGAEVSYPWSSFTGYADGKYVAVFFVTEAAFHTVPKRAMDEAGWAEVRRLMGHVRIIEC